MSWRAQAELAIVSVFVIYETVVKVKGLGSRTPKGPVDDFVGVCLLTTGHRSDITLTVTYIPNTVIRARGCEPEPPRLTIRGSSRP